MLAERRHDVDDLNHRARQWRAAAGALHGPELDIDGRAFKAGDRVLCLRNDRRLGVHNGTLATVTGVDAEHRAVTIRADAGTVHELPARYLDAGHLTHGYAMTIHKSQGLTVDRCLVLATDTLDHNAGYTALSRGKAENRIYLHGALPDPEATTPTATPSSRVTGPRTRSHATGATASRSTTSDRPRSATSSGSSTGIEHGCSRCATPCHRTCRTDIEALTSEQAELIAGDDRKRRRALEQVRPGFRHRHERLAQRLAVERTLDHAAAGLEPGRRGARNRRGRAAGPRAVRARARSGTGSARDDRGPHRPPARPAR